MKRNFLLLTLFICSLCTANAQKWEYYKFPENPNIINVLVNNNNLWVTTSSGRISKRDLNGNFISWATIDSVKPDLPVNIIKDQVLYYKTGNTLKKVNAPLVNGKICFDSKNNIYALSNDTLWKYDGANWSSLPLVPSEMDSTKNHNVPCNNTYGALYEFNIDKNDVLWVSSSCYMYVYSDIFLIDLKTNVIKYRYAGSFGEAFSSNLAPLVDKYNNKVVAHNDTLYVLDDQDLRKFKKAIPIPRWLDNVNTSGSYIVESIVDDSVIILYSAGSTPFLISYDWNTWKLFNGVQIENYFSKSKDKNGNSWTFSGLHLIRNNGIFIDTFTIENENESQNLCYQNFLGSDPEFRYAPSIFKGSNEKVWISMIDYKKTGRVEYYNSDWNQVVGAISPEECTVDSLEYLKSESLIDSNGDYWFLTKTLGLYAPLYDTVWIQKLENNVLKTKLNYVSTTKKIDQMKLIDEDGNLWFTYGEFPVFSYSPSGAISNINFSDKKIIMYNGSTWTDFGNLDANVTDCFKGQNNDVWVITRSKLMHYKNKSWTNYSLPALFEYPHAVIDNKGTIWYGNTATISDSIYTFTGYEWKLIRKTYQSFKADEYLDGIWTYGTNIGASYTTDGIEWINFDQQNGLLNNYITRIITDHSNNTWFLSEGGISKFNISLINGLNDSKSEIPTVADIYPNPATDKLYYNGVEPGAVATVFSADGRLMVQQVFSNSMEVSKLSPGAYILQIQTPETIITKHFIKN